MIMNRLYVRRVTHTAAVLALLFSIRPTPAQYPAVSNLADLTTMVDGSITGAMSRMVPPGQCFIGYDFGVVLYGTSLDTNFLATLSPVSGPGGVQIRPLEVIEQADPSRVRVYFNAVGVPAYTSAPPSGYDWMATARDIYGNPPAWLSGEEWTNWYADRDPARLRPRFTLLSETGLTAYVAALEAMAVPSDTNYVPAWISDSNRISFVRVTPKSNLADLLVYAPSGVTKLIMLQSQDLMNPTGWTFSATLNCASNMMPWRTAAPADTAFYAAGTTNSLDGSLIPAIIKEFVYGLSPTDPDTDGDGVSDLLEICVYGSSPNKWSTGDNGVSDGWMIAHGFNPRAPNIASGDPDCDGLSNKIEYDLGSDPSVSNATITLSPGQMTIDCQSIRVAARKVGWRQLDWETLDPVPTVPRYFLSRSQVWTWTESVYDGTNVCYRGQVQDELQQTANSSNRWDLASESVAWSSIYDGCPCLTPSNSPPSPSLYYETLSWGGWTNTPEGGTGSYVRVQLPGGCDLAGGHFLFSTNVETNASAFIVAPLPDWVVHSVSQLEPSIRAEYWSTNSSGAVCVWNQNEQLDNEYTTEDMLGVAAADVECLYSSFGGLDWGVGLTTENGYQLITNAAESAAFRVLPAAETNITLTAIRYRIRAASSQTGEICRATVLHLFTPAGATTSQVVLVTNYFAMGTGGEVIFSPEGTLVEPPSEIGTNSVVLVRMDIDADTDRNGVVDDHADEAGEDQFTTARGVLLPVAETTLADGQTNSMAGTLPCLLLRKPVTANISWRVRLRTVEGDGAHLNIYNSDGAKLRSYADIFVDDSIFSTNDTIAISMASQVCRGGSRSSPPYEYVLRADLMLGDTVISSDCLRLKIAPLILPWDECSLSTVYVTAQYPYFDELLNPQFVRLGTVTAERWAQDMVKLGSTQIRTNGDYREIAISLNHPGTGDFMTNLCGASMLPQTVWSVGGNGGNIIISPPVPGYPFGRPIVGNKHSESVFFLNAQGIQTNALLITNDWLLVGHTDEVIAATNTVRCSRDDAWASAARTFRQLCVATNDEGAWKQSTLAASLSAATNALFVPALLPLFHTNDYLRIDDEIVKILTIGDSTGTVARMQAGTSMGQHPSGAVVYAISELLRDNLVGGMQDTAVVARISQIRASISSAFTNSSFEFVEVPVLFQYTSYGGDNGMCAVTANLVNGLIEPPTGFKVTDPGSSLFLDVLHDRAGLTVEPNALLWDVYHVYYGEIHCGVAQRRVLPTSVPWWVAVPDWR